MALMPLCRVVRKSMPPGLPDCEARYCPRTDTMDLELTYVNVHVGMMRHSPDTGKHPNLPTRSQTTLAVTAASAVRLPGHCLQNPSIQSIRCARRPLWRVRRAPEVPSPSARLHRHTEGTSVLRPQA